MARVLIGCEFSGIAREAFRARGHFAYSCDLLPTEIPGPHFKMDVLKILDGGHPPCTYLTVAGNKWFKSEFKRRWPDRIEQRESGVKFFMSLASAPIKRIAIENPVGIMSTRWRKPDQIIQPYMFGVPIRKSTCLWLKGLPRLCYRTTDTLFGLCLKRRGIVGLNGQTG